MEKITATEKEIVPLIVHEFREWISNADGADLVRFGIHGELGVTLDWLDDDEDGTVDNLVVGIISTSGNFTNRERSDETSDFADYLNCRLLVGLGDSDSDIDEVLQEWKEELPHEDDDEVDEDDPTGRIDRFESLLEGNPEIWPLARKSLNRRIDQDFLDDISQLVEEWLDRQRERLTDEA
ncbi:MAG: hypothetical protein ACRYGA_09455 [Janthinobacterium lividum]